MTNNEVLTIRLPAVALARLDDLCRREPGKVPSRPEMIRRLIERSQVDQGDEDQPDAATAAAIKERAVS